MLMKGGWHCAGLQPIAETYGAIMHALMVDGDKDGSFKVFQSMLSAGVDARKGWLLLCKDWFSFGCVPPPTAAAVCSHACCWNVSRGVFNVGCVPPPMLLLSLQLCMLLQLQLRW
jgi:pentatricopeptide repeat protein